MEDAAPRSTFLSLPTEIRLHILDYVYDFGIDVYGDGFCNHNVPGGIQVDDAYTAAHPLSLLLTCRQFHHDFSHIAYSRTPFVITDIYSAVPERLALLHPSQVSSIRSLSIVIGARQFRDLVHWRTRPFNLPSLQLDTLKIVLHRSAHWLYPSDFTTDLVSLLRRLQGTKQLVFVRNGAHVKGFFKTWYNRLIGLMLKEDHYNRYDAPGAPKLESVWWEWRYDDMAHSFTLDALPPKEMLEEERYMEVMKPRVDCLMRDMENEEEDPDPRTRNGWA